MYTPFITIITVCFNSENYIEKTIKSILEQKFDNYEYLIIDGKSKDNTLQIIDKYKEKFKGRLTVISENDNGIYDAMNKALRIAKGEFLCFMNSDDSFVSDAIANFYKFYKENRNYDIYYGDTVEVTLINNKVFYKNRKAFEDNNTLKKKMMFCHQSCFLKRKSILKIGEFDLKYKIASDWEFFIRCNKENLKFKYMKKYIAYFARGGCSNSDYSYEKHLIRKQHKLYKFIDLYFLKEKIIITGIVYLKTIINKNIYNSLRKKYFNVNNEVKNAKSNF